MMLKPSTIMSIIVLGIIVLVGVGFFYLSIENMDEYEEKLEDYEPPAITNVFYIFVAILGVSLALAFYLWRVGGKDNGKGKEGRKEENLCCMR